MATGVLGLAPKKDEVATYSATQAQATAPTAVGYKPNEFTVKPEATVANQLDAVTKADSPLLQQAKRRAELKLNQAMNERGMLNSSLALGAATEAAESALYDKALPIAQADAQMYGNASFKTTDAQNAALYAKMQADNAASMRNAELQTNVSLANADARTKADAATAGTANQFKQTDMETSRALQLADKEYQRAMATATLDANTRINIANMDNNTRINLANIDRNTRVELAAIENNYRQLLQLNQDAATMYNQVSTNIANIASSNLSENAKLDATQTQINLLQQALSAKQAVAGTRATTGTTPSGPTAPNVAALNIGSYFQTNDTRGPFDQARYDLAMADYRRQLAAREESWKAWDRGGRSGPWNPPVPTPPNRDDFYGTAPTTSPTPTTPPTPRPTGTVAPPLWQPIVAPYQPTTDPVWRSAGAR